MIAAALSLIAATPELPPFSFREHNTVQRYDPKSLFDAGCKVKPEGVRCLQTDRIANQSVVISYIVVDLHLAEFRITGFRESIPVVVSALVERYGSPCESGSEIIHNGLGNAIPITTLTWCFRTGKMTFRERDGKMNYFSVQYDDEVIKPLTMRVAPDF